MRRVFSTLSDTVYEELEIQAQTMGRTPAHLSAYLIEFCLTTEVGFSEYQKYLKELNKKGYDSFRQLLLVNMDRLLKVKKLKSKVDSFLQGEMPSTEDRLRIALELKLSEQYIDSLIENGNKSSSNTV